MIKYYSQLGQDKFIDDYLDHKESGIFLDIGASNGIKYSNSLFFEQSRNWSGICIEPGLKEFEELNKIRKSININACISDYDGVAKYLHIEGYAMELSGLVDDYDERHKQRIVSEIEKHGGNANQVTSNVFKLQTILDKHNLYDIDYCSIDTEGSEFNIVKSIDYDKTNIHLFSIENNYGDTEIQKYLETKGYSLLTKLHFDDIFVKVVK